MCVDFVGEDYWSPAIRFVIEKFKEVFEEKKRPGDVLDFTAYILEPEQRVSYGITGTTTVMFDIATTTNLPFADGIFLEDLWSEVRRRVWTHPITKEQAAAEGVLVTIHGHVRASVNPE